MKLRKEEVSETLVKHTMEMNKWSREMPIASGSSRLKGKYAQIPKVSGTKKKKGAHTIYSPIAFPFLVLP